MLYFLLIVANSMDKGFPLVKVPNTGLVLLPVVECFWQLVSLLMHGSMPIIGCQDKRWNSFLFTTFNIG